MVILKIKEILVESATAKTKKVLRDVPLLVNFTFQSSPMETVRTLIYYNDYFITFYNLQSEKVKIKIDYVLYVLTVAKRIPKQYFQHITDTNGLYEIRIKSQGNIFRIFCCFDQGNIVVLFNGFQKKSQKTPQSEIKKAMNIMHDYFLNKRFN